VKPTSWGAYFRCKTAQGGYSPGDELLANWVAAPGLSNPNGVQVYVSDTTNIKYVMAAFGSQLMRTLSTSGTDFQMTSANWVLVIRAKA
jgi:hypothetical protein